MKHIKLFLLLFLYVFGPVFRPIGDWFDLIFVISFVLVAFMVVFERAKFPPQLNWLLPLFLVSFYVTGIMSLQERGYAIADIVRILLRPLRIIITFLGGYYVIWIGMNKWKLKESHVLFLLYMVFAAHALIMVFQFISPSFKDWIYDLTFTGEFRSSFGYNFRMGGLSGGSGGAILSSVMGVGLIFPAFAWRSASKSFRVVYLLLTPLLFTSILISGRSGLFIAFLAFGILIFLSSQNPLMLLRRVLVIIICTVMIVGGAVIGYEYLEPESDLHYALGRTLDTFLALRESGQLGDSGFSTYKNFFQLPNDLAVWLFGDPEYLVNDQFDRLVDSDIGFIRNVWSYGMFFAALFWFPIFAFIKYSLKRPTDTFKSLTVLFLVMVIMHIKESGFYVRMFWSIVSLFFAMSYLEDKYLKESHETDSRLI